MNEPQNQTIDIQEELLNRYEALPQDLKETMMSVETAETIFEIGKKFGLNIEKTGKLAEEIGFVILGIIPSKDFVGNLKDILEVDADKALGVASEVNHRIFLKIRDTLKTIHGVHWIDQLGEKPIDAAQSKPFETAKRQIKASEFVKKNKEEIPSILFEIKPTEERPTTDNRQPTTNNLPPTTEDVPKEIRPTEEQTTADNQPPAPPLDTTHEIAAPVTNNQQSIANTQPPEGLPVKQPTAHNPQQPQPAESDPSKKYWVDPYREPFE